MRRKAIWAIAVACFVVTLTNNASAFNGQRRGFILGLGLGPGLTPVDYENKIVLANTNFKIGAGLTDQFQLYWSSRGAWYKTDFYAYTGDAWGTHSETELFGVAGLGVSYYMSEAQPSMYITGTVGYSAMAYPFESDADSYTGVGLSMGVGYEFAAHYSVEATLVNGSLSSEGYRYPRWSLQVTFNALAY